MIDCSGRNSVIGSFFKLKKPYPNLKKFSVFAHYENVGRDPGPEGTYSRLVRGNDRWFWMIPLSETKMSIGVVMNIDDFKALKKRPEDALDEILRKNKPALGAVLEKIYGLAGPFPGPFGIEVVTRLGITEACPLLMRTYLTIKENVKASPEYKNVADAVDKLGCKNQPIRSQP